jgi:hypothetical protein
MTSNLQPLLATFRVADAALVIPAPVINLGGTFALGFDVRDIHFEPGGNRAFLTQANPPSVMVLDTRPLQNSTTPGQPINKLVDIIDVCQAPSHMGVRRSLAAGAPGAPTLTTTQLYVACFLSNQIMVVDPDRPGVSDTILVGRGPNDLAFNFSDWDASQPLVPAHRRAWVTQFSEHSLGEIDLEPGSPTENRLVARIGKPVPPPTP